MRNLLLIASLFCLPMLYSACSDARAQGPVDRVPIVDTIAPPVTDGACPCPRPFKVLGSFAFGTSGLGFENRLTLTLPGSARSYEITDVQLIEAAPSAPQFRILLRLYVNGVLAASQIITSGADNSITLTTGVVSVPGDVVELGIDNLGTGNFSVTGLRR